MRKKYDTITRRTTQDFCPVGWQCMERAQPEKEDGRVEKTEERIRAASIATERQLQNEQLSASDAVADSVARSCCYRYWLRSSAYTMCMERGKEWGRGKRESWCTRARECARAHVSPCIYEWDRGWAWWQKRRVAYWSCRTGVEQPPTWPVCLLYRRELCWENERECERRE